MADTALRSRLIGFFAGAGIFCLAALPISVLAVRLGVPINIGLPAFALSGVLALLVIICLVIVSLLPRYRQERGRALLWTLPAIPPVILILAILGGARDYPPIHDITTDTEDPPLFDSGVYYRGDESNPVDINPDAIAAQQTFYTGLETIITDMAPNAAFERASSVAESLEWEIYNSDPANGRIEAQYTSFWFGFTDDIVIRIRPLDGGSELDLRSVSRVGVSDMGANAARVRAFIERF